MLGEKRAGHSMGLNPLGEVAWDPHWSIHCNNKQINQKRNKKLPFEQIMMQPYKIIISKCSKEWIWSICSDMEISPKYTIKQMNKQERTAQVQKSKCWSHGYLCKGQTFIMVYSFHSDMIFVTDISCYSATFLQFRQQVEYPTCTASEKHYTENKMSIPGFCIFE